jgi:hypothetical protein
MSNLQSGLFSAAENEDEMGLFLPLTEINVDVKVVDSVARIKLT